MLPHVGANATTLGTVRFEHLTINDGLSQSSVNALLQDNRGFIWIGTQDGLNRFDGYDFVVYRHDATNANSLSSNNVSSLYEDQSGDLWVGTINGTLHRFDRGTEQFERYRLSSEGLGGGDPEFFDAVRSITTAGKGGLWVGTRSRGVWYFDPKTRTLEAVAGLADLLVNVIHEDDDGVLWIGTDERGLVWYWPSTSRIRFADADAREQIYVVQRMSNGELWAAGNRGVMYRFGADRLPLGEFSTRLPLGIQNYQVRAMVEDGDQRVWIGFIGGGVQAFSMAGERLAHFAKATTDPFSLSTDTAFSLLLDESGVLWVGSLAAGLSKANLAGARFHNYWHQPENRASLSHNMVNEFAEDDDGNIWIGTSGGGVSRLDRASGLFDHYRASETDTTTLSSDRVWGMHLGEGGDLWVGTWGGGLNRLDTDNGRVERIRSDPDAAGALPGTIVTTIVGDGGGGIWVGMADGGLARMHRDSAVFERHYLFNEVEERDRPVNVSTAFLDSRNRLWVGLWTQGLCMLEDDEASFECFAYDESDVATINDNNIRAIDEDDVGNIWVATAAGVCRFDELQRRFTRLTTADGLPEGTIYGVLPEGQHALWLSSNQGIARVDMLTSRVRKYNYEDGLQANEFNGAAYLESRDGTFFFGGTGGITSFRPKELFDNPEPPKVVLTELRLFNDPVVIDAENPDAVLRKAVGETESVTLRHSDNVLSLRFAGLHFISPELNTYAYRLGGFDRDWVRTDASRREATYTNLDPGEYEFRVRAANSDGVWSIQDAALRIVILPPWWQTWWAQLIFGLAIVLTLLLFVRWRLKTMRVQTRRLESEVAERTHQIVEQKETIEKQAANLEYLLEAKNQFFARLSHEFRTPITLMLGPIEEQIENAPPGADKRALSMARRNGRRLLHLVNQLLGLARQTGDQSIELSPTNVSPVAKLLADSFLPLLVRKELQMDVDAADNVWVQGNAEGLQIILSNLVSNAIKYTELGGNITLTVRQDNGEAIITVTDSGVGIAEDSLKSIFNLFERASATGPGSGIGLTLVKELVDAHDGTIDVHSVVGEGTTFKVRLPALDTGEALADPAAILVGQDLELFIDSEDTAGDSPEPVEDDERLPRVLVVEDNRDMREFVVELLRDEYTCMEAADGQSGMEIAAQELPDIVISDIMMPHADGFELLRTLRNSETTSHIPIVMLTALDDQENRLKGLTERADDYISKPFDRRELLLRVRNLLELTRIRARRIGQAVYASEDVREPVATTANELGQRDRDFLAKLDRVVAANYQDAGFRLDQLAEGVHMSPRQLQRKLKALLDTAPAAYLRDYRLKQARAQLFEGRAVTDVAYGTGFSSVSYFGKCYRSRFGVAPSGVRAD